jgi:hypothetical protein
MTVGLACQAENPAVRGVKKFNSKNLGKAIIRQSAGVSPALAAPKSDSTRRLDL